MPSYPGRVPTTTGPVGTPPPATPTTTPTPTTPTYLSTDPYGGSSVAGIPLPSMPTVGTGTVSPAQLSQWLTQSSVQPSAGGASTGLGPSGAPSLASLGGVGTTPGPTGPSGGMAPATLGETRLINGQLAQWDGTGWKVD